MSCDSPANSTVPDKSLEQVMKPFDEHLTALRAELMKPHVKYNEETLLEISNLIRTSEMFLKTAQVLLTWIFPSKVVLLLAFRRFTNNIARRRLRLWRLWRRCGKSWKRRNLAWESTILGECRNRFFGRRTRSPGTRSCRCRTEVE